jgi:protein-disulfide isomerase
VTTDETYTFKRSHFFLALLPITFVLGLAAGYVFWGLQPFSTQPGEISAADQATEAKPAETQEVESEPAQVAQQESAAEQGPEPTPEFRRYDVPIDDDPVLGSEQAEITLIEFSDYECPFCRRWHQEVFDKIREDYPEQVRFVYRDFPLTSLHPNAVPAAEAANCANEQEAFWEFNEKLFKGEEALSEELYIQYAQELELDAEVFEECIADGRYNEEVMADYQYASTLGVQSTPTFFLNGIPLVGAQPYEVFKEVIEQELAGEIP